MAGINFDIMETANRIMSKEQKTEANSETEKAAATIGNYKGGGWIGALVGAGGGKSTVYETENGLNKNTLLIVAAVVIVAVMILKS